MSGRFGIRQDLLDESGQVQAGEKEGPVKYDFNTHGKIAFLHSIRTVIGELENKKL